MESFEKAHLKEDTLCEKAVQNKYVYLSPADLTHSAGFALSGVQGTTNARKTPKTQKSLVFFIVILSFIGLMYLFLFFNSLTYAVSGNYLVDYESEDSEDYTNGNSAGFSAEFQKYFRY